MHHEPQSQGHSSSYGQERASYAPGAGRSPQGQLHGGVEKFMIGVFGWMSAGLAVTAVISFLLSRDPRLIQSIFINGTGTGLSVLAYIVMFAPLAIVWFAAPRIPTMSSGAAKGLFFGYAALIGLQFSPLPLIYPGSMLAATFATTAAMFGGTAAFGFFTKKDLSGMGRFLMMMFWGVFVAWIVGMFVEGVQFYVAVIGVPLFAGLTAYYTQEIKQLYLVRGGRDNLGILGALTLYINFINLFIMLLRLFAASRD